MEILGWFEGFVSGICDGPPPQRIAELLALAEAGIVSFIGPDMRIEENRAALTRLRQTPAQCPGECGCARCGRGVRANADAPVNGAQAPRPEIFTVTSAQAAGEITGSVVIDAASPTNSVSRAADVLAVRDVRERSVHCGPSDLGRRSGEVPQRDSHSRLGPIARSMSRATSTRADSLCRSNCRRSSGAWRSPRIRAPMRPRSTTHTPPLRRSSTSSEARRLLPGASRPTPNANYSRLG